MSKASLRPRKISFPRITLSFPGFLMADWNSVKMRSKSRQVSQMFKKWRFTFQNLHKELVIHHLPNKRNPCLIYRHWNKRMEGEDPVGIFTHFKWTVVGNNERKRFFRSVNFQEVGQPGLGFIDPRSKDLR